MENTSQTSQKMDMETQREGKSGFFDLANKLLSDLPERSQEIIKKRFGMAQKDPQTLEKIGKDFRITRERVRQIIADALKRISQKKTNPDFQEAENRIIFTIEKNNGIMKESELLNNLGGGDFREANAVVLFGSSSEKIQILEEKKVIKKSWVASGEMIGKVRKVSSAAYDIFQKEKKLLTDSEIVEKIRKAEPDFSREQILDFLEVLYGVQKNKFGKWGLSRWKEVNPKGTKERIYLVLKEAKKPMHFTEIASLIDKYGLSKKKAHPQTVHNELIKDSQFILVGRGIYALKEWGYEKGTIKDVLVGILEKSGRPMSREEILAEALCLRKVKSATVVINLNNRNFFTKTGNSYAIKK